MRDDMDGEEEKKEEEEEEEGRNRVMSTLGRTTELLGELTSSAVKGRTVLPRHV